MSLSARLDRLRGRGDKAVAGDAVPPANDLSRGERLLGKALGAEEHDGLLVRDRSYRVPAHLAGEDGLNRLPEASGRAHGDWVYLDTETTGLSGGAGNLAFMVGLARYDGSKGLHIRQYVLGSFSAECAMLQDMLTWIGTNAMLVSYNGKCFDVPLLQSRLRLHRLAGDLSLLPHIDLMYPVRRAFRRHWPDCRLLTAEDRLLDLHRVDDLPGAQAPAAWQAWLRQGATARLAGVLRHNFQDVASLALLHARLVTVYEGGGRADADHAAIGRAWRDAGDEARARQVWERAGNRLGEEGCLQLAASYRRLGDWIRAETVWLRLFARGSRAAACELSKYYEHRRRDLPRACRFAAHSEPAERDARLARLQHKLAPGAQLPLWDTRSVGEGDEVGGTV